MTATVEQRRHPRFEIEAPAILRVREGLGPFLVTLLDVSVSGLRLSSPVPLPAGTPVIIKCVTIEMTGEVRYSRPIGDTVYNIGVQVDSVSGSEDRNLVHLLRRQRA